MEVKENSKRALVHIKRLATSNSAPVNYDSNESVRVLLKKRARNGVITINKQQGKNTPKHNGAHQYCML